MIFGMGVPELVIILIIALVIFGPAAFFRLGESTKRGIDKFRDEADIDTAFEDDD